MKWFAKVNPVFRRIAAVNHFSLFWPNFLEKNDRVQIKFIDKYQTNSNKIRANWAPNTFTLCQGKRIINLLRIIRNRKANRRRTKKKWARQFYLTWKVLFMRPRNCTTQSHKLWNYRQDNEQSLRLRVFYCVYEERVPYVTARIRFDFDHLPSDAKLQQFFIFPCF